MAHSNLRPNSMEGSTSNGVQLMSPVPSDMVGPSPVTSNGTNTTDIEDEVADELAEIRPKPTKSFSSADSGTTVTTVCGPANVHNEADTAIAEEIEHECR